VNRQKSGGGHQGRKGEIRRGKGKGLEVGVIKNSLLSEEGGGAFPTVRSLPEKRGHEYRVKKGGGKAVQRSRGGRPKSGHEKKVGGGENQHSQTTNQGLEHTYLGGSDE